MLNRLALRLCVVQALIGKTFAQDSVKDSEITVIDPAVISEAGKPFIAVYTDDQEDKEISLVLEIGVTARMTVLADNGEEVLVTGVPPTDAGIELSIDLIERQIWTALQDPANPWSELVRRLYPLNGGKKSVRGASKNSDGERFAGRQVVIVGTAIADPEYGYVAIEGDFWSAFLSAMNEHEDLQAYAPLVSAALAPQNSLIHWSDAQRALALSRPAASALGMVPVAGDDLVPIVGFENAEEVE